MKLGLAGGIGARQARVNQRETPSGPNGETGYLKKTEEDKLDGRL